MSVKIIGVYPVQESEEPCHLIELLLKNYTGPVSMVDFTQRVPAQPKANWQVPYDEYLLNESGDAGKPVPFPHPIQVIDEQRIAFFFHYLELTDPLQTPFGDVSLPMPSPYPHRLTFIKYQTP
jgi:hypothetical protein